MKSTPEQREKWRAQNKLPHVIERKKQWRRDNYALEVQRRRDRHGVRPMAEYLQVVQKSDEYHRVYKRCRQVVTNAMCAFTERVRDHLGCSAPVLRQWLESQFTDAMTWDNYKTYWTVDHRKPIKDFNILDPAEFAACCHYLNLRPLENHLNIPNGHNWYLPQDGELPL